MGLKGLEVTRTIIGLWNWMSLVSYFLSIEVFLPFFFFFLLIICVGGGGHHGLDGDGN